MKFKLITPVINGNGSSAESLIRQRTDIMEALDKALELFGLAMPHGRDYQTHPETHRIGGYDPVGRQARDAWMERIDMIRTIYHELETEAVELHEQMVARYPKKEAS